MTSPRKEDGKGKGARKEPRRKGPRRPSEPGPGPFRDILLAPDRDAIPGAWPTVSYRDDDDPGFLAEVRERMVGRVPLCRRGVEHGWLAVLDPRGLLPPPARRRRRLAVERERWVAARPIVLPGALAPALERRPRALDERELDALLRRLREPSALQPWLAERLAGTELRVEGALPLEDPERDLARVAVAPEGAAAQASAWVKSARLSLHAGDEGLRLRVSFGEEGADDGSADEEAHARAAALGARVLPGAREVARSEEPRGTLERLVGAPVLLTQGIGYWNAPQGGARMHHDAFSAEDDPGRADGEPGQRGVVYVQLAGRTAWIALSLADLAERVGELLTWLAAGDAPWLVEEVLGGRAGLADLLALRAERGGLAAELARPGCGRLGPLVESGPELTGMLVDAGHAALLRPGDAILLPNHGLERTAMHAVFCASPRPAYGVSLAVRAAVPVGSL